MTDTPDAPDPPDGGGGDPEFDDPESKARAVLAGARPAPVDPGAAAQAALHERAERGAASRADAASRAAEAADAGAVLAADRPDSVEAAGVRLHDRLFAKGAGADAVARAVAFEEWLDDPIYGAFNRRALAALAALGADKAERPVLADIPDIEGERRETLLAAHGQGGNLLAPGGVCILAGDGGLGKSTLAGEIALAFATGRGMNGVLDVRPAAGRVLWVAFEEYADLIRDRTEVLAKNRDGVEALSRISVLEMPPVWPLYGPAPGAFRSGESAPLAGWAELESAAAEKRPGLIIIDPLAAACVSDLIDMTAVRGFLDRIAGLGARCGGGILLIAHSSKAGAASDDPLSEGRLAGARQWLQGCRGVLGVDWWPGVPGARRLTVIKANNGPAQIAIRLNPDRPMEGHAEPGREKLDCRVFRRRPMVAGRRAAAAVVGSMEARGAGPGASAGRGGPGEPTDRQVSRNAAPQGSPRRGFGSAACGSGAASAARSRRRCRRSSPLPLRNRPTC